MTEEGSKKDTIKTVSHKLSPTQIEPDSYSLSEIVQKAELASHRVSAVLSLYVELYQQIFLHPLPQYTKIFPILTNTTKRYKPDNVSNVITH